MREDMLNRLAAEEGEARRRHEEAMSQLALERERQLLELDATWRKRVAREEVEGMRMEGRAAEQAMARRELESLAKEKELAREASP